MLLLEDESSYKFTNDADLVKFAFKSMQNSNDPDYLICSEGIPLSRKDLKEKNAGKYSPSVITVK